jgi:hypothetical protein
MVPAAKLPYEDVVVSEIYDGFEARSLAPFLVPRHSFLVPAYRGEGAAPQ